jgi:hypothetical protein
VTLNITVVSRDAIYQSSDFRLTLWDPRTRTYRLLDSKAQKQVPVFGYGWSASVCFTGVGSNRSVDTSEWLAEKVGRLGQHRSLDHVIQALQGADDWLRWVPLEHRRVCLLRPPPTASRQVVPPSPATASYLTVESHGPPSGPPASGHDIGVTAALSSVLRLRYFARRVSLKSVCALLPPCF